MATSMKSRIDKLAEWLEEVNPFNIMDYVYEITTEYFGKDKGIEYYLDIKKGANENIEYAKKLELAKGNVLSDEEIQVVCNLSVITYAWHQAAFIRQQYAQAEYFGTDAGDIFNLEEELCRKYPFLREAFDILDDIDDAVSEESILSEKNDELPF